MRCTRMLLSALVMTAAGLSVWSVALCGQSLLERPANMSGGWTGSPQQLHFHLVHRFNHSGAPARQVQNSPTFLLGYTPTDFLLAGVHYATRSALVTGVPNEWELFVRSSLLRSPTAGNVALQLGYNAAAESVDGELSLARTVGMVRLIGAARGFSSEVESGRAAAALAAGAVVRLHEYVAVAGDLAQLFGDGSDSDAVWGLALQLRLPTTPHTLSLHAVNSDATTLHAASRAAVRTRWGFEFTVPVTPRRYLSAARRSEPAPDAGGDVVTVTMRNLRYEPDTLRVPRGTVVEWRNQDPLEHTATAVDGSWDSGPIAPGAAWRRRFAAAGRHEVVCTPHPFMRAVVIVE